MKEIFLLWTSLKIMGNRLKCDNYQFWTIKKLNEN